MRLHPVFSIILGVISSAIIFEILTLIFSYNSWLLIASFAVFIGGFLANYFTKIRRIIYGTIMGFITAAIVVILGIDTYIPSNISWALVIFYVFPAISSASSFFAEMTDKMGRQRFRMQYQMFMFRKRYVAWGIWLVLMVGSFTLLYQEAAPLHFSDNIYIQQSGFSPEDDYAYELDTVTWTNNDTKIHRIVSDDGLFDSGNLSPGQTFSYVFRDSKVYSYHDTVNSMNGTVRIMFDPPIT